MSKLSEFCENTNHKENKTKVELIRLRMEFNYDLCNWCLECQKRDSDMILHKF